MGKTHSRFKYLFLSAILYRCGVWFGRKFCRNFSNVLSAEKAEFTKFAQQEESLDELMVGSGSILKDYLIPGSHNDHQPKILRTKSLLYIVLPLLILKVLLIGYLFWLYPNEAKMSQQISQELSILVNQVRVERGLTPLQINTDLEHAALAKAQDIMKQNYLDHRGPDGKPPWAWIDADRYHYELVGENLATNFASASALFDSLLNIDSAHKNILSEKYQDMGIAVINGELNGQPTNILVQLLASRQAVVPAGAVQEKPVLNEATPIDTIDPLSQVLGERLTTAPQSEVKVSPNLLIDNQLKQELTWQSVTDSQLVRLAKWAIIWSKNLYLAIFIILSLALAVNIIIKIRHQHRQIIAQTILALIIVSVLCWWPVHLLEHLTGQIGLL